LPDDLQVFAFAEPLDVAGDDVLDAAQVFFAGCFGTERECVRGGPQGALAPAEADDAIGFGPFDVLHPWGRLPVTGVVRGWPVAQAVDLPGVFAELGEIPARLFGLDVGFGGWHLLSLAFASASSRVWG